ncbi:MAG: hypothetical protein SCH70_14675, partial [Candidatus Methanoperedens sp.]|nr:hypothetical protein [Candidatus Methanoperedens sp.]
MDLRTNHKNRDEINMEQKIKHLEFIQGVVNRMATNSFLIKGWCITLVSALFALAAKDANFKYIIIAFIPVPVFWILDSYYLWQERLFRALYDQIRVKQAVPNPTPINPKRSKYPQKNDFIFRFEFKKPIPPPFPLKNDILSAQFITL